MEVTAKKISKSSLFKILVLGNCLGLFVLCILFGVAAFFGAETVQWNDEYKTGLDGLFYSILMGPIFGFFFACVMWVYSAFGLWVYSLFRPIKITFVEVDQSPEKVV
ncbi:hypothetical protein RT723_01655 [Psychrosphaera aquimarina]|uniref:Uncharacterized protein n=1 Tax=Psychrosphaera aquimarina TaxID=2044854 RepID=A0ABU3QWD1_9GAMM|nr:hypothetical protein [Psychrosphaera aquimarina]MDU0111735.1 hypothetical protein [Psychrosphaera aquimarina]